jgi:periplasmic iron binding protein
MSKYRRIPLMAAMVLALVVALTGCVETAKKGDEAKPGEEQSAGLRPGEAGFEEFPLGDEVEVEGMEIAGVYFQAVDVEPREKGGLSSDKADIHIEADISAGKNNKLGFGFGDFIPYLQVDYKIKNLGTGDEQTGTMMPMNASDGAHYGANVKMGGAGQYEVTYIVHSAEKMDYLLHVDEETGVPGRFWKKPIEVSWEFNYVPLDN